MILETVNRLKASNPEAASAGAADTITVTDILAMRARIWGFNNAIWLANHDTIGQIGKLEGTVGHSNIFNPRISEAMPDTLLGRPIFFTEYTKTLGDANDILLLNMSQYLEGQLGGVNQAQSIHVRFLANEECFKFSMRNDGKPWWNAALTPRNSTATLSPFVGLAERA